MADEKELKEAQVKKNLDKIKHRIMVMSGKGGVGKSFVAVNLAYGLAMQGKTVGILDSDVHGPSMIKLTGTEGMGIPTAESGMPAPIKVLSNLYVLSVASLISSEDAALIWRGPMKMALIKQFFSDFDWPELDYLIIDCPPGTGDEPLSIVQILGNVDGAVIVNTPQDIAILDVKKSVNFAQQLKVPILGVVENMKYFRCPDCGKATQIVSGRGLEKLIFDQQLALRAATTKCPLPKT
jgi:Mrp family chromosome partitioning ATPase